MILGGSPSDKRYHKRTIKVEKNLLGPTEIQTQDYDSVSKSQKPLKNRLSST
jgi:hypothetical protein